MPTPYYKLREGALNQDEILFKDTKMAIPQLDMKEMVFSVHEIHMGSEKNTKISKFFF